MPASKDYHGHIDFFGYHKAAAGYVAFGWASHALAADLATVDLRFSFEDGELNEPALTATYPRPQLGDRGTGLLVFVFSGNEQTGKFLGLIIRNCETTSLLRPAADAIPLDGEKLQRQLDYIVSNAKPALPRDVGSKLASVLGQLKDSMEADSTLNATLARQSLSQLRDFVRLEVDQAIFCPPNGLALIGWMLPHPTTVGTLFLHSGGNRTRMPAENWIDVDRAGVADTIGREVGLCNPRCGFIAYFPEGYDPDATSYLEVATKRGETGYKDTPAARVRGIPAVERILAEADFQFSDVEPAFDRVLGPAIERLTEDRLRHLPDPTIVQFGPRHTRAMHSIVVPLYRRLDYMDMQLGLMAVDPPGHECEYIYVLDDPPRRREAENLAALLYARHRQPITLVLMAENAGFAPACNAGLRAAQGEFVCFLNSDVFPDGAGWLDRLCARLDADPTLGIVGPMLVYEDGSVQHRGMYFHQLPQFGNWWFGDHPGKGLKPGHGDRGLKPCISITGACMVMRRDLAQALGGFDEGFVVGDFEDSDLCFRVQARGLGCSVDLDERLYHLERKSQASSALRWRMNLTVFNAWRHQRRWGARIAEISALLALTAAP